VHFETLRPQFGVFRNASLARLRVNDRARLSVVWQQQSIRSSGEKVPVARHRALLRLPWLARWLASWALVTGLSQAGWAQTVAAPAASLAGTALSEKSAYVSPTLSIGSPPGPLSARLAAACPAAESGWPAGWTFFEAALVASGVEDADELARWTGEYAPRRERIVQAALGEPVENRAARLHELVHAILLRGPYVRTASDVRVTLRDGSYNCLVAAAFFWDLGQAAGLKMEIWTRPGHAYVKLHTDQGPVAWEPGMPPVRGVLVARPANSEVSSASGRRHLDQAAIPQLPPSHALSPRQLIGRFYYNRAVERLQTGQYACALQLLSMSLRLDPADADARQNYLAGLNNWAVASWQRGNASLAAELIRHGLQLEPTYAPLQANQRLLERKF
jgi:tetratricopeptide (TPR) repeat protein